MMSLLRAYPCQTLAALFVGCVLFKQLNKGRNANPNSLPLPPGPKGYPLIGNLFDIPIHKPWLVYDEWCKTYGKPFHDQLELAFRHRYHLMEGPLGDIVYFNVLGKHFLVLGSLERTSDLFDKRSSNYSDRMRLPMLGELYVFFYLNELNKISVHCRMKWDFAMPFMPYGIMWRKQRRLFHEKFQPNMVSNYLPIQRRKVLDFLYQLLVTPDNLYPHIQQ